MDKVESTKTGRTLVLCFDGTANQYDGDNTNVVKFFSLLKKDDFNEQLCYYQAGVGTYFNPGVVSPFFQWAAKMLDLAFAWYLGAHVMDGYRFLMQNYRVGDKICIFGFSRGAYTARALGGMLYKVGLLPRDNQEQIPFAYRLYKKDDDKHNKLSKGFKKAFCQTVEIEFMGVWDTVASVGLVGRTLPFTYMNTAIKTFRHALALDEHRVQFRPNYFHHFVDPAASALDADEGHEHTNQGFATASIESDRQNLVLPAKSKDLEVHSEELGTKTDVLEVWFAGCHCDVGGGAIQDEVKVALAPISLRWMVRQVIASRCPIRFDEAALIRAEVPVTLIQGQATKMTAERQKLDKVDALHLINDELKINRSWWILEAFHHGAGRDIDTSHRPNFHTTVKQRMAEASPKYTPKAKWKTGSEIYVE